MVPRAAWLAARLGVVVLLSLGALGGAGCTGGGGGAPPDPPTGFTAAQNPGDFDQVDFAWTPPAGAIDGYEGEGRLAGGAWESLGDLIPPDAIGGTIGFLQPTPPELTEFSFRLRSVRGAARSAWTPEAAYHRTLRPPTGATATMEPGGLRLAWQNGSLLATGVAVELWRGQAWEPIAQGMPAGATSHLDAWHLVAEELRTYRILATAGPVAGMPLVFTSAGYPARPVSGLAATTEPGGVRLRWTNPPIEGLGLVVHRGPLNTGPFNGPISALLPIGTGEFLDASAPPGAAVYEVELRLGLPGVGDPRAQVVGVASPAGLLASPLLLPEAAFAARDGQGRLALAVGSSFSPPATGAQSIAFHGAGAPPPHDLGVNHGWAAPGVRFDPDGHPHAVVVRPVGGGPALIHAWFDGLAWSEEQVVAAPIDDPTTVRFEVGPDGALHAAWSVAATGAAGYARRGPGGWAVTDLAPTWPAGGRLVGLAVDGAGRPSALARTADALVLLHGAAAWLAEPVPAPTALAGMPDCLAALPDGVGVLRYRMVPSGDLGAPDGAAGLVARTAAGWGEEAVVFDFVPAQPVSDLGAVASAAGDRWVAWAGRPGGLAVRLRDGAGAWTDVDTGLRDAFVRGAWFDAAGKAGLLVRTTAYAGLDGALYVLYGEP